jgi:hypothetical protein
MVLAEGEAEERRRNCESAKGEGIEQSSENGNQP